MFLAFSKFSRKKKLVGSWPITRELVERKSTLIYGVRYEWTLKVKKEKKKKNCRQGKHSGKNKNNFFCCMFIEHSVLKRKLTPYEVNNDNARLLVELITC